MQADDAAEDEAGRFDRETQVNRRTGQQSWRLSRRCKLTTGLKARSNGSVKAQAGADREAEPDEGIVEESAAEVQWMATRAGLKRKLRAEHDG